MDGPSQSTPQFPRVDQTPRQHLNALAELLEASIGELAAMQRLIDSGASTEELPKKMEQFLQQLRDVDNVAKKTLLEGNPVLVPFEVVRRVDEGKNPDVFVQEQLLSVSRENDQARSRVFAARMLQDSLASHMAAAPSTTATSGQKEK